jgi:hypothetical protein
MMAEMVSSKRSPGMGEQKTKELRKSVTLGSSRRLTIIIT